MVLQVARDNLIWREVGDEVVVLNTATAQYLSLNRTAATLWRLLLDGGGRDRLAAELQSEFGLERDAAERDVHAFIRSLEELDVVRDDGV